MRQKKSQKKISIVTPVLNEESVLSEFYNRVRKVLELNSVFFEIIFVNDGSTDKTPSILLNLHNKDSRVKIISFSRNFGHASAISAGLNFASGDATIVMDADLQDPPEVLESFIKKWKEGYHIVNGIKTKRKENFIKRFCYWFFYRLLSGVSSLKIPLDAGAFCLMDRRVVDIVNSLPERNRFLTGLRTWTGFRYYNLEFERADRFAGKTKYSLKKLFRLAADGIFSFSYVPLRLTAVLGFVIASISLIAILIVVYLRLFAHTLPVSGFASTIIVILFLGGMQLMTIGLLGEYIARIYDEVKRRPLYVIKEKKGFNDEN